MEKDKIFLLSLPNRNMDYPGLSLPMLTAHLRHKGYNVEIDDVNIKIRDKLITKKNMDDITDYILPEILLQNMSEKAISNGLYDILSFFRSLQDDPGTKEIEKTKEMMQARRYNELLTSEGNFENVMKIFKISRAFHDLIDILPLYGDIFRMYSLDDPISTYYDNLIENIKKSDPLAVGLSILDIQRRASIRFMKMLREKTDSIIIVGGTDPTRFPTQYLKNYPFIDYLFYKEAEITLPKFLDYILRGEENKVEELQGLCYRKGGRIYINESQPTDYSKLLTPCFSDLPLDLYLSPVLPIQASRGCYWSRCKFCIHWKTYSQYIKRPAEKVVEDIISINENYNTNLFHFTDDGIDYKFGTNIASQLLNAGLHIKFISYARFESKFNREIFKMWYRAGARIIEWGLESASQRMLDTMDKGINIKDVPRILKDSASVGIINKCFMFHDYPSETLEELKKTIDFVDYNIRKGIIRFFLPIRNRFELLKGSIIYDEVKQKGVKEFRKVWFPSGDFSIRAPYLSTENYKSKEMMLNTFLREMDQLAIEHSLFSTNDDNITLDLMCADLVDKGYEPAFKSVVK